MNVVADADVQGVEIHAPWRLLRSRKAKIAFTLDELVQLTSQFSLYRKDGTKRTDGCFANPIRTDRKQFLAVYRVRCNEKDKNGKLISDPAGHVVRMKFDVKRMQATHKAEDLDVRVSCSCPAFLYWGAQWNLSTGDALYGAPRPKFQPPTEPRRYQNVICKHIKVASDRVYPLVEGMISAFQGVQDEKKQQETKKQIEQVKQQQEQEVEEKTPPITPKKELPTEGELEAMPEDLTTLGLPAKAPEPKAVPKKRKPITPKAPPTPPEPEPELPPAVEATQPPEEAEEAPGPKARRMQETKKKKTKPAPNITVHDEDDDEVTVLPGSKARRMIEQRQERLKPEDIEVVPRTHKPTLWEDEDDEPGPKAKRMERAKLPTRVIHEDDEDDEPIILPGRRRSSITAKLLLASLALAATEV